MAVLGSPQVLRKLAGTVLQDLISVVKNLRPDTLAIQVVHPNSEPILSSPVLWAGASKVSDDCKKLEKKASKKTGPVCKAPDLRKKPVPPYQYGYCKEPEPELPMSCPPRATKRKKGPCCLNEVQAQKGGCRGGGKK